ncbi:YbaK/EbsC family protein [Bifidobacterium thermophilum]|uniref:YbaK/EbsC family protein n=1 Tax=Bifidobacterium thermophilum TaxID=33905 RepID=UPI0039969067
MSFDNAHDYLASYGYGDRIIVLDAASGTVAEAAQALGTQPERIAKSLSFLLDGQPIIIATKGTARVDNRKYKATFHNKASMIPFDEVDSNIGHEPVGMCPFGIKDGVRVHLDRRPRIRHRLPRRRRRSQRGGTHARRTLRRLWCRRLGRCVQGVVRRAARNTTCQQPRPIRREGAEAAV